MEIQAVVEMMSREVATLPRVEPSKRNVAVPLSPISSITQSSPEAQLAACPTLSAFKSVQTVPANITTKTRKSIQVTSSSIELLSTVDRWHSNERSGRKSKSQEELRTRKDDFRKEMLQLLESIDCHGDELYQAFRDELVRKIKKNWRKHCFGIDGRAKSAPFWFKARCRHCVNNCRRVNKFDVFRVETRNIGVPNVDNLHNAIKDWLQEIQLKNSDVFEQHSLDHIVSSLAAKLRQLCLSSEDISKSEIMQMIEEVTFDASDSDRNVQLNNLADALTTKIKDVLHSSARKVNRYRLRERISKNKNTEYFPFKKFIQPTEEEVRGFIRDELLIFVDKFNFKLNSRSICDIETEVIDVLLDSFNELQWGRGEKVKEEIAIALRETSKLPEYYLTGLAEALINRFKDFMCAFNAINMERVERQNFIVLQNTVQNTSSQPNKTTDFSIEPITSVDIEVNIEKYTSQLTQVIEAWWTSILGADENEKGFREVAINDLAGDIVDRHRFLEMDTSKSMSNKEEVEYLKFQIFRWINKLVGDEAMQQAIDRAPELMEQIQRIPVPMMRIPEGVLNSQNAAARRPRSPAPLRNNSPQRTPTDGPDYNISSLPMFGPAGPGGSMSEGPRKQAPPGRRMSGPASYSLDPNAVNVKKMRISPLDLGGSNTKSPTKAPERRFSGSADIINPRENRNITIPPVHEINEDLENYVNDWLKEIPIPVKTPQEQELAEKLRLGIRNGVWKALAKAEMDPAVCRNSYYFQDQFDNELEELLSCLPPSPELALKKPLLKAKLKERTADTIKAMYRATVTSSYKYQLWNAITSCLPQRPKVDDQDKSTAYLFEEFLKLNLAEDYLLFKVYKECNRRKGEAYRRKVLMTIQKIHENAKLLPGSELINADMDDFSHHVLFSMTGENIPNEGVLQDEADQIILGHEISQWLQGLPIAQSEAHLDQLQRRRLRDTLAKKIHEIEKQTNLCDNSAVRQVKNELSKFLEKLSPRPEEAGNLPFLIDEFINRLKYRREDIQDPSHFPLFYFPHSSTLGENIEPIETSQRAVQEANQLPSGVDANTQEKLQRQREAKALEAQSHLIPPCCHPAATMNLRPQGISGHLGQNEQIPYREPSNVEWLTMLNTQERIKRGKEALEAQAQLHQIPPCCQAPVVASQMPGVIYDPAINVGPRGFHASQVAGPSYDPMVTPGRRVVVPATAPTLHSEMRRLVDLQDQRPTIMPMATAPAHLAPSGVGSFVQPPAQSLIQMPVIPTMGGILGASQIPGPSGMTGPNLVGPGEPCIRATPLVQRSVHPRQIRSPQQVMSRGSPINQSQFEAAAPLAQQEQVFVARHDFQEIPDQNISHPMLSPLDLSIQAPVGFSTPRQFPLPPAVSGAPNVPGAPRARRKRNRDGETVRPETARRRLDLEESEEEEERERDDVQCRCTERMYRCRRRRPMCCDCEDMDYPRYYPMPYPYCFF